MTSRLGFRPFALGLRFESKPICHPERRSPRRPESKACPERGLREQSESNGDLRLLLNKVHIHQAWPLLAFLLLLGLSGCHSYHIDTTIENRTGADIQLLEVDYPSAGFGVDRLASGAVYHYRFQVRGSGPLTVSYAASDGRQAHITGPNLFERQQGQLQIVLLPGKKADFVPLLSPSP
jgi:hypothetical protein